MAKIHTAPASVCALMLLGLLQAVLPPPSALGQDRPLLVSDLPLGGDLLDRVTGQPAFFSRPTEAYTSEGGRVNPDQPRFERFAVGAGYQWNLELRPDELVPLVVAGGELFATDKQKRIWASRDGVHFEHRSTLTVPVNKSSAAWPTPSGALLISCRADGSETCALLRSGDGGRTFQEVLAPLSGYFWHWNFATVGADLYVSEYGPFEGPYGNARRIYKAEDDGRTWRVVYEPPPQDGYHNHQIVGDSWGGCVYQQNGDFNQRTVRSCDGGRTWEIIHDYYQSTGGIARPDQIFWGRDGIGVPYVARHQIGTNRWAFVLRPYGGYEPWYEVNNPPWRDTGGNCYSILDYRGVLYAPYSEETNEMWASADGRHWALLRAFDLADWGVYHLAGGFGDQIYGLYLAGRWCTPKWYLSFRPGRVATIRGLRIEPPATNLLPDAQASSAELGLSGWSCSSATAIAWAPSVSYHGRASVRCSNPNIGSSFRVECPVVPASVPVGTVLHAQIRLYGDEAYMWAYLYDRNNGVRGLLTWCTGTDEWTLCQTQMEVTHPNNAIRLVITGSGYTGAYVATVWLDGYQITDRQTGQSWQLGGVPRAGETLRHPVAFPAEWTDFICLRPDFSAKEPDPLPRTVKAWVEDASNYAQLVFDPADRCFKLIEVIDGQPTVVCTTAPKIVWRGWTIRAAVRSAMDVTELRVRLGGEDLSASGPPLRVHPVELWIGSSPVGWDQAPGLYALSRTFQGALSAELIQQELDYLTPPLRGDCNCDGVVDFGDINPFVLALASPVEYARQFPECPLENRDINGDYVVDFADINPFVYLLSGGR